MGDFVVRLNLVANLGWQFLRAPASPCSPLTAQPCRLERWRSFLGGLIPYSCFEMSPHGPLRSLPLCWCSVLRFVKLQFPRAADGRNTLALSQWSFFEQHQEQQSLALPFLSLICTPYPMSCLSAFQRAQYWSIADPKIQGSLACRWPFQNFPGPGIVRSQPAAQSPSSLRTGN